MKRVSFNSHQSQSFDEEARIRIRHQSLLQDYLDLQKEFVSKKKKLKTAEQKREILLAEVRFLRLRQAHLLKMQYSDKPEIDKRRKFNVEPEPSAKEGKARVSDTKRISDQVEGREIVREVIRIPKKPKNCLINVGKRAGKKKISVQDRVVLEA